MGQQRTESSAVRKHVETPRVRKVRELRERHLARNERVTAERKEQARPDREHVPMRVRATRLGYFGHMRRRSGDVFDLDDSEYQFSPRWMEEVPVGTPESITSGQDELQQKRIAAHGKTTPTAPVTPI